ncbi:hypothetical protein OIDMADRAFT_184512 [Oidiodendron maius Zn]|uniref:Transcription factor domain-containing protein n=1 Tax=Oidiodendron maius (strain Zn) TaxID=913774 RepID=A0A0C3CWF6_OIDMZ|nr:hypothetical protein OIDMADRAFT_184512 [Oidiodendron maius Zn]
MATLQSSNPSKEVLLVSSSAAETEAIPEARTASKINHETLPDKSNADLQAPSQPPHLFITTTRESPNGRPSSQSRKLARSHVTNYFYHGKRSSHLPFTEPKAAIGGVTSKLKLISSYRKRRNKVRCENMNSEKMNSERMDCEKMKEGELPRYSRKDESSFQERSSRCTNPQNNNDQVGVECEWSPFAEYRVKQQRLPPDSVSVFSSPSPCLRKPEGCRTNLPLTSPDPILRHQARDYSGSNDQILDQSPRQGFMNSSGKAILSPRFPPSAADVPSVVQPLPQPALRRIRSLVHHYITVFAKTNCHIGSGEQFFSISRSDMALYNMAMLISAAQRDLFQQQDMSYSFYYHLGEVIRVINLRLKDGEKVQSDATIATVACILGFEAYCGTPQTIRTHWAGLKHLVAAKGGLELLGMDGLLRKLVEAYDLRASLMLQENPLFYSDIPSSARIVSDFGPPDSATKVHSHSFSMQLMKYHGSTKFCRIAQTMFWGLRNLTLRRQTLGGPRVLEADRVHFSDAVETLMRTVCALLNFGDPLPSQNLRFKVFEVFAYGAVIYIFSTLRDMPVRMSMFRTFTERLRAAIDRSESNVLMEQFPALMLWALFQGGQAAVDANKAWFTTSISELLLKYEATHATHLVSIPEAFLWPEIQTII